MTAGPRGMLDARERVSGQVSYVINHEVPGMLHARVLRSLAPHARIVRIDTSRARRVPGVLAVVTGAEIAARSDVAPYFGPVFRDQPVLAIDKVRYVGEPVVAAVADDLDAAREALALVEVEYAEMPAVFTCEQAMAADAPALHEQAQTASNTFADIVVGGANAPNVCNHFTLRKGDVDDGFRRADHIFEHTYSSPPVQHVPFETHACIARVQDGQLTVWATTQTPHVLRAQLAEVFKTSLTNVRVIVPTLGGGYGAKCYPKIEPLTAVLALIARRPVRLHLSREEEFITVTKHGAEITLATAVMADGTIVARRSRCLFNTGAYADIGPRLIRNGGFATGGPHNVPHVAVDSFAVYTNLPPAGAFRGYGVSQAAWAYETQMDTIAEHLGIDPYELRMKNLLVNGQSFATGETLEDCHFRDLLEQAAQGIGWNPREPAVKSGPNKVRAKGLSCVIKATVTPSTSTASVKLNEDGSVDVLTSAVEMGQGLQTALATIAAERFELSVDRVHVSQVDTDVTPYDQQTSSSRSTHAMGTAVIVAVDQVREQLLHQAAPLLEVDPADLEVHNGVVQVKGAPDRALTFSEIVRRSRAGNLLGHGTFASAGGLDPHTGQGVGSVHWHQAAGAAEVEVDLETGSVQLLRYHGSVYAGRTINPVQAELQTEGCVAFGLGQAFFEEMVFDGGQLQNGNLGDYMVASIQDMPSEDLGVTVLENHALNEIHGIGETSLPPVMPAIGNAVYRATGVRITDLPITPEKILRGLRQQEEVK